jgi:hypothetical protein
MEALKKLGEHIEGLGIEVRGTSVVVKTATTDKHISDDDPITDIAELQTPVIIIRDLNEVTNDLKRLRSDITTLDLDTTNGNYHITYPMPIKKMIQVELHSYNEIDHRNLKKSWSVRFSDGVDLYPDFVIDDDITWNPCCHVSVLGGIVDRSDVMDNEFHGISIVTLMMESWAMDDATLIIVPTVEERIMRRGTTTDADEVNYTINYDE